MTSIQQSTSPLTAAKLLQHYALGERDFSDIHLDEGSLAGAKLPHVNLQRASLKAANLSAADLSHSNLQQAACTMGRLSGVNLSQAQLQRAQFNVANLIQAVLVDADLTRASLVQAELLRANLSNSKLVGANLQEADLREVQLRWSQLQGANLSQGNLRNSNLVGANFRAAKLYSTTLENANLRGAVLQDAELPHANLRAADLSGVNLRGANLRWADLSGANLQEADLTNAKLSGANLTGARLDHATLHHVSLVHADLSRTCLQGVHCVGVDFSQATLTGVAVYGATCYDAQTADTRCQWVDLSPQGDQSQRHALSDAIAVHAFFNRRPPQVRVLVDTTLTQAAHRLLATTYDQLGQRLASFTESPSLERVNRRTTLTFTAAANDRLLALTYLVIWPFQDGDALRSRLADWSPAALSPATEAGEQGAGPQFLRSAIAIATHSDLQDWRRSLDPCPFFMAPIQVKLVNNHGQTLELYQGPRFGTSDGSMDQELFPRQPEPQSSPPWEDYQAFLASLV